MPPSLAEVASLVVVVVVSLSSFTELSNHARAGGERKRVSGSSSPNTSRGPCRRISRVFVSAWLPAGGN